MNHEQATALSAAGVHATDAEHEINHAQGWVMAIFRAIERAGELDDARTLADIGRYLAERHSGIVGTDLAGLKRELDKLSEVAQ